MGILKACLKNAIEAWPAIKAGFQGAMESPWESAIRVTKTIDQATQPLQVILAPDIFYKSDVGQGLAKSLVAADTEAKLTFGKFITDHEDVLKGIDPTWQGAQQGQFDKDMSDALKPYLLGETKTADLPAEYRNVFAKLKSWVVERYNATDAFKKEGPKIGGTPSKWELDDNVIDPTVPVLFNKNSPNMAQYGLVKIVPKEIPLRIAEKASAADATGVDWLRAAVPMIARKNLFDPVVEDMRAAIPNLSDLERQYTERMINRLTGKKTTVQDSVDAMIETTSFAFGGAPMKFSPSAKVAAGIQNSFFKGIMLYNPGMALLNLTQSLNTLAKEGMMPTLRGLTQFQGSALGRSLAAERSFLGDMDKFFFRSADQTALKRGMEKFEHVGYKLFNGAENFNRGLAFHVGLSRFMQENGIKSLEDFVASRGTDTFREGMLSGINAANETQFLYGVVNQSPLLTTPFAKIVGGQFMSFPLRQTEFMMKQIRQGNYMFFPRFIGYTGAVSAGAFYGLGYSIGEGGGSDIPEAVELAKQGKVSDAVWAGTSGLLKGTVGKFLADPHSLTRGITPFGGLMIDTLALASEDGDPEQKWANFGRSFSMLFPAMLSIRRAIEGGMTQYVQEGERHKPRGFLEGTSLPVALSRASKEMFDAPIPGVSDHFSGALSERETGKETLAKAVGVRSAETEMENRMRDINRGENQDIQQGMTDLARDAADALIHGTAEQFNQAIEAAMKSGNFVSSRSLHQSIEGAIQRQLLTDKERQGKHSPLAARMKRSQE